MFDPLTKGVRISAGEKGEGTKVDGDKEEESVSLGDRGVGGRERKSQQKKEKT